MTGFPTSPKFAIFLEAYQPGGYLRMVQVLSDGLLHLGVDLTVFMNHDAPHQEELLQIPGLKVLHYRSWLTPKPSDGKYFIGAVKALISRTLEYPFLNFIRGHLLSKRIRDLGVDRVIVANGGLPGGPTMLAALFAARRLEKPAVFWLHSMASPLALALDKHSFGWIRRRLSYPYRILVPSKAVLETIRDFGVSEDQFRICHNFSEEVGLRSPTFDNSHRVVQILCPATFLPYKGQETLIRALKEVNTGSAIRFQATFVGDDPKRNKVHLVALTKQLGLQDYVMFSNFIADRKTLFQGADLVVLPSLSQEAFGLVLVEAMSAGIPVIGSRVGGIPEVMSHFNQRLLFEPGDHSDLAKSIAWACSSSAHLRELSDASRGVFARLYSKELGLAGLLRSLEVE